MDESRRNFLKVAGCAALGAAWGIPVIRAIGKAFESEPAPGVLTAKRWAMVVDIGKCQRPEIQRAAIMACHMEHNVPQIDDPEDQVKWIWAEEYQHAFPVQAHDLIPEKRANRDKVLVLCNHCFDPPCTRVCPTQATWKRGDGIVMMDMHRCIGCRYCIAACPYGSRSFNFREPWSEAERKRLPSAFPARSKGVVEKCNFCAERLALGKPPACVEAVRRVPGGENALLFGDLELEHSGVARILRGKHSIRRKPNLGTGPQVYYLV
jgi:molybdopterin-containing oxidoreductase family iron-sulfur binding subunit